MKTCMLLKQYCLIKAFPRRTMWNDFIVCLRSISGCRERAWLPGSLAVWTDMVKSLLILVLQPSTLDSVSCSTFLEKGVIYHDCWIIPGTEIKRHQYTACYLETIAYINIGLYEVRLVFWSDTWYKHYAISFLLTFFEFLVQPHFITGALQASFTPLFLVENRFPYVSNVSCTSKGSAVFTNSFNHTANTIPSTKT